MPTQRFEASLAAATPLANLLSGSKFVSPPFPAAITIYAVQDGADAGDLKLTMTMGTVVEIDDAAVPTYTANQGPDRDKHLIGAGVSHPHDQIQIRLVNEDAVNAANYRIVVDMRQIV